MNEQDTSPSRKRQKVKECVPDGLTLGSLRESDLLGAMQGGTDNGDSEEVSDLDSEEEDDNLIDEHLMRTCIRHEFIEDSVAGHKRGKRTRQIDKTKHRQKKKVGKAIAGGYVYKSFLESPHLQALYKEARMMFLEKDMKGCKDKLLQITNEMGGGIVDRDVYQLLASVNKEQELYEEEAVVKYYMIMRLGGQSAKEFKELIGTFLERFPRHDQKLRYLCKKAVSQKYP